MSGAVTAVAVGAIGANMYMSNRQEKAQRSAQKQAQQQAQQQVKQAEQDMNRANQKRPDSNALLSAAQQSGRAGASGTMLTGPQGVDQSALTLGKSTLLGQ